MRRMVLAVLALATALMASPRPVTAAYNLPWCAQFYTFGQVSTCSFETYGQCLATISGVGGVCVRNAKLLPYPAVVQPLRRRPRQGAPDR